MNLTSPNQTSIQKNPPPSSMLRITTLSLNMLMILLLAVVAYLLWVRLTKQPSNILSQFESSKVEANPSSEDPGNPTAINLPSLNGTSSQSKEGIIRKAILLTTIPERSHVDIITYTVVAGDTLFSISEQFQIKPTTLLWGNFDTLEDNPHLLKPGQVLYVLPVDGTYHHWQKGDTIEKVAEFYKAEPGDILAFSGNVIDLTTVNSDNSGIQPDTWIVVPGGKRAIKDWGPPAISRDNPASARSYGPGSCGAVYEGAVGIGSFLWPTNERYVSGFGYDPGLHSAIDIAGEIGNAVYASDSGVVVYAGWSDYGYGYLIVIDHGFGWQTAYAHLSAVGVSCGQSVLRGSLIGALGSTGNSTGAHLHFELVYNGAKLNPKDFLQ